MKKILILLCFYGASLSTYAVGPSIQNIGVENPNDDILQVGVFEQTLSNFIAALTLEDVQTLRNFLTAILKGPDREEIFTAFQADMQEKGLWSTMVKLCLFLTEATDVKYTSDDKEECDIVKSFSNVRAFLKKHPKYMQLFQRGPVDFSQMEGRCLSIPLTQSLCGVFAASLSIPILCYNIPGTPEAIESGSISIPVIFGILSVISCRIYSAR